MSDLGGRQSPPPEQTTDAQTGEPASGSASSESNQQSNEGVFDRLESNPKGVLDDEVTKKFAKTQAYDQEKDE
jgi:hypothetical protein